MSNFKIQKKIELCDSTITKLLHNPYNPSQIIITSLNGGLTIWKLPKLQQKRKITLPFNKITFIVPFHNSKFRGFLIAVRNGQLAMINQNFEVVNSSKIHKQPISQILFTQKNIITLSYDGVIKFLNKQTLQVQNFITLQTPLFSAVYYDNHIYVASTISYIINIQTFQKKQTKRYNSFLVSNGQIFGCSQDRGLSCLDTNSNNYLPAQFILPYHRKILIFSEKSICVANQVQKLAYKATKYDDFSAGQSITSGFYIQNNIYVGGNEGNIYWIVQNQ